METEEVEDILQEFVNKSLLFCDRNGKSFRYYLHDLQVDFLTEKNRTQLQVLVPLYILSLFFTKPFILKLILDTEKLQNSTVFMPIPFT